MSANGQLKPSELVTVQAGLQLAPDAATDYLAMKHAGMPGQIAKYGAYRDLALQAAMHNNPAAYGSSLKTSQIAQAGYSTHGFGENADLINGAREWAIAWGAPYGWTQRDPKNDPNCFKHAPGVHSSTTTTASTGTQGDPDMPLNAADVVILNQVADSIIQHITGSNTTYDTPAGLTIKQLRADLGYLRDTTLTSILTGVGKLSSATPGEGLSDDDVKTIIAAIQAQPAATVAAIKAAL